MLIVEDSWPNRALLQNLLIDLGFEVQTAINGQEAIVQWQAWHPHLIFMDIRMPLMDGYEATRRIRWLEQQHQAAATLVGSTPTQATDHPGGTFGATKIIALTAGMVEEKQPYALKVGCDDFAQKPIHEAQITQLLGKHLGVRFRYETDPGDLPHPGQGGTLTVADLQALSADWRQRFQRALMDLDPDHMVSLIQALPPEPGDIAQSMTQKVQNFEYETLLDLIEASLLSEGPALPEEPPD
ncbi:MAG: response regulator [Leptolyngbyaceae cyanobacterium SM2_3_12]|nr:response regulator [Leptolyngbyaceae cyanobacterium SM2_3_12]